GRAALAAAQLLPAGPDGALVAAFNRGLAAAVESVPERRLRLVGLDMAPPMAEGEAPDAPRRLSGRVTLEADLEGLAALLRALDAGRPRFVATALSVRPRLSGGERDLDVHIDLAALAPGAAS
ncbi:MAG TPA: GspMb/PilO family protein, partial [Alphaproteobacteria bacterium]|nr:GspMb/PilO family protein [Alphaproteobacteria bacterium]